MTSLPCIMLIDIASAHQDLICRTLRGDGFQIIIGTTREAPALCEHETIDLIMLGLHAVSTVPPDYWHQMSQHTQIPIITLIPHDIVIGALPSSLDIYLTTPFTAQDLLTCVDAALRRKRQLARQSQPDHLRIGRVEIDLGNKRLLRDRQIVRLSRTEWALLEEFIRHRGAVLTHSALLRRVWGDSYSEETTYLHVYMNRLRRKLEDDPANPCYLRTEAGIGYRFELPDQ